jgi:hypothetical protein
MFGALTLGVPLGPPELTLWEAVRSWDPGRERESVLRLNDFWAFLTGVRMGQEGQARSVGLEGCGQCGVGTLSAVPGIAAKFFAFWLQRSSYVIVVTSWR